MNEDRTRELSDNRSFEERVFARFDAMETRFEARFSSIDARLDRVEARLNNLDTRVQSLEARALDTKPIWERALAEIFEVREAVDGIRDRVENIERKFDVLALDMMQLRGDQRRVDKRMDAVESRPQ